MKSHTKNILIYDILYKNLIGPKPLHIRFGETGWLIKILDGVRYLALLGSEKSQKIFS